LPKTMPKGRSEGVGSVGKLIGRTRNLPKKGGWEKEKSQNNRRNVRGEQGRSLGCEFWEKEKRKKV